MNRRDGFKTMSAKVIVLLKRDLNYKLRLVSNEEWGKKVWIFLGLSVRGNPDKTRLSLPPLLSRILWGSLPFVDDPFQFVFWISSYFILTWLLARYSPLYLCLSCSLPRSSRRILPILASSLTFLCVFLDSLYAFYLLPSLIVVSFFPVYFTQNPFSTNLNYNNFLRLTKLLALPVSLHGE